MLAALVLAGCATAPPVNQVEPQQSYSEWLAAERAKIDAECKRVGSPRIGMTIAQVEKTCFGKPERVNRTVTAGHAFDQFVYADGNYLYFTDGVLTSFQQKKRSDQN